MPSVNSPQDLASRTFDYIIVGAGTCSLRLAINLSNDPLTSVLVLEAGRASGNDNNIDIPHGQLRIFGNPEYDWAHETVPQPGLDGRWLIWNRGKGVGGSSAVNFLCWSIPDKEDINDWERMGNRGWNWERYHAVLKRATTFTPRSVTSPTEGNLDGWTVSDPGTGPVQVSFPKILYREPEVWFQETVSQMGILAAPHPHTEFAFHPMTFDPVTNTRSYIGKRTSAVLISSSHIHEDLVALVESIKIPHLSASLIDPEITYEKKKSSRSIPGPECQTDEELRVLGTSWHTIGSASMLPREKGGVVDSTLKVYGCTNLRVVDMSIVPIHISAHTQAMAYLIGEIASEIMLQSKG